MTTTHSAPGKTHRFSEHAADHGMRTIASATNPHTTATIAQSNQTDQVKNNENRNDVSKINSQTT